MLELLLLLVMATNAFEHQTSLGPHIFFGNIDVPFEIGQKRSVSSQMDRR